MNNKITENLTKHCGVKHELTGFVMPRFEYYLRFWGQIENGNLVKIALGIKEKDFWFTSAKTREEFKATLKALADKHKVMIAFREEEGELVRFRTVAKMTMVMPNGKEYEHREDFGYAYKPDAARYMFEDGNYSCDCNKSLFLSHKHPEIEEMDCGNKIQLKDFTVVLET